MSLMKSIATVSGWTSASRLLGFVRDVMMARFLGAGMMADAFFVALRFPNLFRSFFAEGSLNVAFVPLFSGLYHTKGKAPALQFAAQACSVLLYVLLIFTIIAELAMPYLVFALAPGFDEIAGKLPLTASLTRITFPFLMCISVVSLLGGMLNAIDKFWAPAFVPIILNLCMIGFMGLSLLGHNPYISAYALAVGVCCAGIIEVIFMVCVLKRQQMLFKRLKSPLILFKIPPQVKVLMKKMVPGIIGSGVYQINLFLDTFLVSFVGAGAISWLNYAYHIFQLPIGIIGCAISTTLLPLLSKHIKTGEKEMAVFHLNRGLEISVAMALSSMIGLTFLSDPVVRLLFEGGRFTAFDATQTAQALVVFAWGLPAYMLTKAVSPFFYARGDTVTPVKIAAVGMVINVTLACILMFPLKYIGIALATTCSVWVNAAQYMILLYRQGDFKLDSILKKRVPCIILSALVMAAFLWTQRFYCPFGARSWLMGLRLFGVIAMAGSLFIVMLVLTRVIRLDLIKGYLKRK